MPFLFFVLLSCSLVVGCVPTSGGGLNADEQIALIKELEGKCQGGEQTACEQVRIEKNKLFQVYGCHCSGQRPKNHPIVRRR